MPAHSLKPCAHPGCGVLVTTRRCEQHTRQQRQQQDSIRGTSAERGYDYAWRQLRSRFLQANPLCQCDECTSAKRCLPATVVDHRIPIEERPDLRLEWSNLRAMAKACHDAHTARTRGFGRARGGEKL